MHWLVVSTLLCATGQVSLRDQIHLELTNQVQKAAESCAELVPLAAPGGLSVPLEFQVAPTGKVKVGGPVPTDGFAALAYRCELAALGPVTVKARGVTLALTLDWALNPQAQPGAGLGWFADDPVTLDRETLMAGPRQTWVRCERKDVALTHHFATRELAKWQALAEPSSAISSENFDSGPFWKLTRAQDGKSSQLARRGDLPKFAHPLEQASGLARFCEPVRALGEKAPKLLEAKAPALAACLKHRHNDLWLTLTLGANGAVTRAEARATAGLDDKALDCLEKVAAKWSFPFRGEAGATVSAHLSAAPAGE